MNQIKLKYFASFIFYILISILRSSAQNPNDCKDTLHIQVGHPCIPDYLPVCGCDNVTYRNDCVALYTKGVQKTQSGICETIAQDFYPNLLASIMHYTVALHDDGRVRVTIFNVYGQYFYDRTLYVNKSELWDIDVNPFPKGLYYIMSECNGNRVIGKFVKVNY